MPEYFDPNDNLDLEQNPLPQSGSFLQPYQPGGPAGFDMSSFLTAEELAFAQQFNDPYITGIDLRGQLPPQVVNEIRTAYRNANAGVSAPTRGQLIAEGVYGADSPWSGAGSPMHGNLGVESKKFPACQVPTDWRMKHQKARGGHIAYLGKVEAAYFTRKASANAFVRAWNEMMSHLGSAADFDQLKLASLFASVINAASGQNGLTNGFTPPMNGQ